MSDNYILDVTIQDGKYTVRCENDGELYALRYGEPWRDLVGDKMVYCLAAEVDTLQAERDEMLAKMRSLKSLFWKQSISNELKCERAMIIIDPTCVCGEAAEILSWGTLWCDTCYDAEFDVDTPSKRIAT